MSSPRLRPLRVVPEIAYPHDARWGREYLVTVDLTWNALEEEWPYEKEEEYAVYCLLQASCFNVRALGDPTIVLHRFGGTYAPARFLLKAVRESEGAAITLTLINPAGVPMLTIPLQNIRVVRERRPEAHPVAPVGATHVPESWIQHLQVISRPRSHRVFISREYLVGNLVGACVREARNSSQRVIMPEHETFARARKTRKS